MAVESRFDNMEYYNGLYSDVLEDVKILCDQHVASKCPVNTGNGCKTKRHICPAVREGTDVALTLFDILCNCQACHSLWVVAGAFIFEFWTSLLLFGVVP